MQKRNVARIDAAFHCLQVIAFLPSLAEIAMGCRHGGPFKRRQRRLLPLRAHIGPHDAAALHAGVGFQLDFLAIATFLGLRRDIETLAEHVVFPAVIRTTKSTLLVAAEPQRDSAMSAKLID